MLDTVLHGLVTAVPGLGGTIGAGPRPQVIKIGGSGHGPSFLLFDGSGSGPRCHLKLARTAERRRSLEHEHATLRRLAAVGAVGAGVPEPLALFPAGDWLVLAQRCLPGTPLSVRVRRRPHLRRARTDVRRALAWLRGFQAATSDGSSTVIDGAAVRDAVGVHAASLPSAFVASVLAAADRHAGLRVPLVFAHGDYWPGNVLLDREEIGVVDWEGAASGRSPVDDLFFFLLTYALCVPGPRWRIPEPSEAVGAVLRTGGRFSTLARAEVRSFLAASGLPASSAHLLGALFLFEQARAARPLRAADPRRGDWSEVLRVYAAEHERSVLHQLRDSG